MEQKEIDAAMGRILETTKEVRMDTEEKAKRTIILVEELERRQKITYKKMDESGETLRELREFLDRLK